MKLSKNAATVTFLLFSFAIGRAYAHPDCQAVPTAKNIAPTQNSYRTEMRPTLRVGIELGSIIEGPCKWRETNWQVASSRDAFRNLDAKPTIRLDPQEHAKQHENLKKHTVFHGSSEDQARSRFNLPTSLEPGREYWWRAAFKYAPEVHSDGDDAAHIHLGDWTNYSQPTLFTTTYTANGKCIAMPAPYIDSPHSGATTDLTPTLKIYDVTSPGLGVDKPCTLKNVEWQVSSSEKFEAAKMVTQASTNQADRIGLNHFYKIPVGKLNGQTSYWWRARVVGPQGRGSSAKVLSPWSKAARFRTPLVQPLTMRTCPGLNPVTAISQINGVTKSLRPTLKVATGGLSPGCKWDQSAWQVIDAISGEYVYQSGYTTQTEEITLPGGILKPNRSYRWRVKTRGLGIGSNRQDVESEWSLDRYFFVQP